jgi:hypothetical protein
MLVGIGPKDGLVGLAVTVFEVYVMYTGLMAWPCIDIRTGNFIQRHVARALVHAIDGALKLPGPIQRPCKAVSRGQSQIILGYITTKLVNILDSQWTKT